MSPYDDRPISEGQPEEIGGFSRKAPTGKFRVVGVDTFDGGDWLDGDYDMRQRRGPMRRDVSSMYIMCIMTMVTTCTKQENFDEDQECFAAIQSL